jgi:hypothetical protein
MASRRTTPASAVADVSIAADIAIIADRHIDAAMIVGDGQFMRPTCLSELVARALTGACGAQPPWQTAR